MNITLKGEAIIITNDRGHKIEIRDLGEAIQVTNRSKDARQYVKKGELGVFAFSDAQPKTFWSTFVLLARELWLK